MSLLRIERAACHFSVRGGTLRAVDGVSLEVAAGDRTIHVEGLADPGRAHASPAEVLASVAVGDRFD